MKTGAFLITRQFRSRLGSRLHHEGKNNRAIAYISIDMGSGGAAHSEPEA